MSYEMESKTTPLNDSLLEFEDVMTSLIVTVWVQFSILLHPVNNSKSIFYHFEVQLQC